MVRYPALRRLMTLKTQMVTTHSHPPLYLPLISTSSSDIMAALTPTRFDVILIHPNASWDETASLPIRQISSDPGFVFLWVGRGDSDGLERGRECFAKWGFRRAEDIVWVKTNKRAPSGANAGGLFASQKEHCLMGIRGTVRRSIDTRFVHCNVDTDVMVWEDTEGEYEQPKTSHCPLTMIDSDGPHLPPYLYTLIENFCLGTRRLELFGSPTRTRRGWVTAGLSPAAAQDLFDPSTYPSLLPEKSDGRDVLPCHQEVDMLRPKSPQRRTRNPSAPSSSGRPSPAFRPQHAFAASQPGFTGQPGFAGHQGYGGQQPGFGGHGQHYGAAEQPMMMMGGPQGMGYGGFMPQQMMAMGMGMGMGYGGLGMINPAMGMGMNPQMGYMMANQGQGINGGQPGNNGQMWQQPTFGGMGMNDGRQGHDGSGWQVQGQWGDGVSWSGQWQEGGGQWQGQWQHQ